MADTLDLLTRLSYLQAGGKPEGQRTIDKVDKIAGSVNQFGLNLSRIANEALARKKLQADTQKTVVDTEKSTLENENLRRGQTPYRFIAPQGISPEQTQNQVDDAMRQPIPAADLISGNLAKTQAGIDDVHNKVKTSQDLYGDLTQKEYLGDVGAQYKIALTEKAKRGPDQYSSNDLTPLAKDIYLKTAGNKLGDSMSKQELNNYESMARLLNRPTFDRTSNQFKQSVKFFITRMEADQDLKKFRDQKLSADQVDGLIASVKSGNTVAGGALGAKMAKAMGEVGVLTNQDVERYVKSGQLTQGVADKLSRWMSGTPTAATLDEISQIATIIGNQFDEKVRPTYDKYANELSKLEGIPVSEAHEYLYTPQSETRQKNEKKATEKQQSKIESPAGPVVEVARQTKDGKTAIFDANTKKFLRYQ